MKITYLNKSQVLQTLYNYANIQGMGFLNPRCKEQMTLSQSDEIFKSNRNKYFDYVNGRVLKIDLSKNDLQTWLYNRDNGVNSAEIAIISGLLETQSKQPSKRLKRQLSKSLGCFYQKCYGFNNAH